MTRVELYVKTKDAATGRIVTNRRVTLQGIAQRCLRTPYFKHWLFGGMRKKVANYVFNYLEGIKNEG